MKYIYRFFLTINATFWMPIIYIINKNYSIKSLPAMFFGIILIIISIMLSLISIKLTNFLGEDSLSECKEYNLADNEFLPIYLGYFFLAVSISKVETMVVVYLIVFIFTYLSQTQYFNPIYLMFGYHYYHILTMKGSRVFVIAKGKVIKNKDYISFNHLRRINDTTYIERSK